MKNHVVWPIFYKVEPSDVRDQRNSYGHAVTVHGNRFGKDFDKVPTWKLAFSEIPKLGGYYRESESRAIYRLQENRVRTMLLITFSWYLIINYSIIYASCERESGNVLQD